MFKINVNVGDIKRVFGIIGCANDTARVFSSEVGIIVDSKNPRSTFSSASIRACGSVIESAGQGAFDVSVKDVLGALSSWKNAEYVGIEYNEGIVEFRVGNITHDVKVVEDKDISVSKVIKSCTFKVMQYVSGTEFINLMKSAHDSDSKSIIVLNKGKLFNIESVGGSYVSRIEVMSDTIGGDYRAKYDVDLLYRLSKFLKSEYGLQIMYNKDSPIMISFDINEWSVDHVIAPIVDYDSR